MTIHPTIARLATVAAPDYVPNDFHGIDIPVPSGVGIIRLCSETDEQGDTVDMHSLTLNGVCNWTMTFSGGTPHAVICAAIAEGLDQ